MAYRESDQPIVLGGRESRPHWLNPDGEGVDSDTQLSKVTLTEQSDRSNNAPLPERNSKQSQRQ